MAKKQKVRTLNALVSEVSTFDTSRDTIWVVFLFSGIQGEVFLNIACNNLYIDIILCLYSAFRNPRGKGSVL